MKIYTRICFVNLFLFLSHAGFSQTEYLVIGKKSINPKPFHVKAGDKLHLKSIDNETLSGRVFEIENESLVIGGTYLHISEIQKVKVKLHLPSRLGEIMAVGGVFFSAIYLANSGNDIAPVLAGVATTGLGIGIKLSAFRSYTKSNSNFRIVKGS